MWVTAFSLFRCKLTSEYISTLLTLATTTAIRASAESQLIYKATIGRAYWGRIPKPHPQQKDRRVFLLPVRAGPISAHVQWDTCGRISFKTFFGWSRKEVYGKRKEKRNGGICKKCPNQGSWHLKLLPHFEFPRTNGSGQKNFPPAGDPLTRILVAWPQGDLIPQHQSDGRGRIWDL